MYVVLGKRWMCDGSAIKKTKRIYLLYPDAFGVHDRRMTETVAS